MIRISTISLFVILIYLAFGLSPFDWADSHLANGVVRVSSGMLEFTSPGIARTSKAPHWLEDAVEQSSLKISLEIRATGKYQSGPARIFTISEDNELRNITIAQDGSHLVVRMRNPYTDLNGLPDYWVGDVFGGSGWHKIDITITPQSIAIEIDGTEMLVAQLPLNPLAQWTLDYNIALGNELTGDRPWLGTIRRAIVATNGKAVDYLQPGALEIPDNVIVSSSRYQLVPFFNHRINQKTIRDWALNFIGFIPLGALIAFFCAPRPSLILALIISMELSLFIEIGQLLLPSRVSSTEDFLLNALGGVTGAWLIQTALASHRVRRAKDA
jgi:VanZ family protein